MDPFKGAQRWPASDVFEVEENNRHGGHPHGYSPPAKIQIFPQTTCTTRVTEDYGYTVKQCLKRHCYLLGPTSLPTPSPTCRQPPRFFHN